MNIRRGLLTFLFMFCAVTASAAETVPKLDADGLHIQSWFYESSQNLLSDLQFAATQNKGLIVLYEQKGCIYCAELHAVNFTRSEIVDLITQNFLVVRLDLNSSVEIVDFDGTTLSEGELATKWGVNFTPTTMVFSAIDVDVQSRDDAEIFRLPGYIEPFYYFTALNFFASREYKNQKFNEFFRSRLTVLEVQGIDPDLW